MARRKTPTVLMRAPAPIHAEAVKRKKEYEEKGLNLDLFDVASEVWVERKMARLDRMKGFRKRDEFLDEPPSGDDVRRALFGW